MKYERVQPEEAATIEQGHDLPKITYGDLLEHVRERRRVELETEHPGRNSNLNAVSNTTRSLTAFMEANDLVEVDVVSEELIGTTRWDRAVKALGTDSTGKRRRTEMNKRVRPWAMELVRAAETIFDDESFAQRLRRLREASEMSRSELASAVSRGAAKLTKASIKQWEMEIRRPSSDMMEQLAKIERVFGVSPGTLKDLLPKEAFKASHKSTGLTGSIQRRVAQHLPEDFDSRPTIEQDEILAWVSENILSAPKEFLEDGTTSEGTSIDLSVYSLTRKPGSRLEMAPTHFLEELDEVRRFKTTDRLPVEMKRNEKWGAVSAEKANEALLAFMGAVKKLGIPESQLSLTVALAPNVIDRFIDWRLERRGGYTRAFNAPLLYFAGLLHHDFGLLAQQPGFGQPLTPVRGMVTKEDVRLVQSDWDEACSRARKHIMHRIKEIEAVMERGRDPFEALLPVLDAPNPLEIYYKIIPEIRQRMPDDTYPLRKAEALRGLMMLRLGLELGFRQKNNRELLLCTAGQKPRTWKQLKRLQRGELSFDGSRWVVRIPGVAFKNAGSKAVHEENTFPLYDRDGLYSEITAYIAARSDLLGDHEDPGTVFVKKTSARTKSAEYDSPTYYSAFRSIITTYGIYNPYTGRGAIQGLRPHGPHSVRHILATASVKRTRGFSDAAALLLDSEEMVREAYARFLPGERHSLARNALWGSMFDEGDAA